MRKKLALLTTSLLVLALVAGMSFAWFTGGVTIGGSDVTTATIKITDESAEQFSWDFENGGVFGGEKVTGTAVTIKNESTRGALARVGITITVTGNGFTDEDAWSFLNDAAKADINGQIKDLLADVTNDDAVKIVGDKVYLYLAVPGGGTPDTLSFTPKFTFPEDIPNDWQGATFNIGFTVDVIQMTSAAISSWDSSLPNAFANYL